MRYGAQAENPEEAAALASPDFFLPAVDLILPLVQARALMEAARLGVFEALAGGAGTSAEVVANLGFADQEGTDLLLRVLACAGYARQKDGRWELTDLARRSMLKGSPRPMHALAAFNRWQWDWIGQLEDVLRTGRGVDFHQTMVQSRAWETYQRAMLEFARFEAPAATPLVPVREGSSRLLDIGGSHGLMAAMLCRQHPGLRGEVLDLPAAVDYGRRIAKEQGWSDLVSHRAGDALADPLGEGWDVVFVGNLLHHFSAEQNRALLDRVVEALAPGGTVAIWGVEQRDGQAPPDLIADGFALLFRITSTARLYGTGELLGWLAEAGARQVEVARPMAGMVLLTGRKQG